MMEIYLRKKSYLKIIKELYQKIDDNDTDSLSINEFFEIIEQMESDSKFYVPIFPDLTIWCKFRQFMNKYAKIKAIVRSNYFEIVMFVILIVNSATVIASQFTEDEYLNYIFDEIDNISLYFYITECLLKIIGFGVTKYFDDSWNVFDFSMVILSLFSNFLQSILSVVKSAKTVKSSRLLRVTKINKLFKAFKALRTVKLVNFCVAGANILIQLKVMVQRIFLCIPTIIKLIPIMFIVFYVWALVGMENFNTSTFPYRKNSPYLSYEYASFDSLPSALMLLFQVSIEANWSSLTYDIAYKFDNFYFSMFYFVTFHLLIQFVLISLVKGIVWEIFTVVEQATKEQKYRMELGFQKQMSVSSEEDVDQEWKKVNQNSNYGDVIASIISDENKSEIISESPIPSNYNSNYHINFPHKQIQFYPKNPTSTPLVVVSTPQVEVIGNQTFVTVNNQIFNQCSFNIEQIEQDYYSKDDDLKEIALELQDRLMPLEKYLSFLKNKDSTLRYGPFDLSYSYFDSNNQYSMDFYFRQVLNDAMSNMNEKGKNKILQIQKKLILKQVQTQIPQTVPKAELQEQDQQFNENFILKKALLKETNSEMIKKIERDYFQENYGDFFNQIQEINFTPILNHQAFLMSTLMRMLRYQSNECLTFFQVLSMIEKDISEILLKKGSFCKFVYQDNYKNWFTVMEEKDELYLVHMNKGIWGFQESIWRKPEQIYVGRDFFQKGSTLLNSTLEDFEENFQILCKTINDRHYFLELPLESSIMQSQ